MEPVAVAVHESIDDWGTPPQSEIAGIVVVDEATESGHPVVVISFPLGSSMATISLKAFLQTVKLVMDSYPEYVREVYRL